MFALFFGLISLLYATVGEAGGIAFLALMAFAAFPPSEMRQTALALNIVAATYSTWVFSCEKVVGWRKLRLLLLASRCAPTMFARRRHAGAKEACRVRVQSGARGPPLG